MPKFAIQYVRMERQSGLIEIEASSMKAAKIEAANRVGEMRAGNYSRGPESWEQDADGHKIIIGCVEPR